MTERTVTVKDGETLSAIALREMGDANRWVDLFARNRRKIVEIQDRRGVHWRPAHFVEPDWIFPGTKLVIPAAQLEGES